MPDLVVRPLPAPKKRRMREPTKDQLKERLADLEAALGPQPKTSRAQAAIAVLLPLFAVGLACLAGDLQTLPDANRWWGIGAEVLVVIILGVNLPHVTQGAARIMRCGLWSAGAIAVAVDIGAMFCVAAIYHAHPATWAGVAVAYGFTGVMVLLSSGLNVVGFQKERGDQ